VPASIISLAPGGRGSGDVPSRGNLTAKKSGASSPAGKSAASSYMKSNNNLVLPSQNPYADNAKPQEKHRTRFGHDARRQLEVVGCKGIVALLVH
jgi:hypothetical protein